MITFRYFFLHIFLIIIYCKTANSVCAQSLHGQRKTDSLLQDLAKAKDDTGKIKTLYILANVFAPNDSATAASYANKCLKLSQQLQWQKGIGFYYLVRAKIFEEITDFSSLIQNAKKAYDILKPLDDKRDLGTALLLIAVGYGRSGFYTKSIENCFEALKFYEAIDYKHGISSACLSIGLNYQYLLQYNKAIENYKKSLAIALSENDKYVIASNFGNIATVYSAEEKYDSANVYDLKTIKVYEEINNLPGLDRNYCNHANTLMHLYDAKSAFDFYNRSLAIAKKLGIKDDISSTYGNMGWMYYKLAKDSSSKYKIFPELKMTKEALLQKSKYYLTQAIALGKETNDIDILMDFYNTLSETEEQLGDYKSSFASYKAYTLYKDSIFNDENKKKIGAMEIGRLTEVKDQQIQLLNQQKALETSQVKRQTLIRNIIIASVFVAAILTFLFIFLYNRKRKTAFDKQMKEVEMKALRSQMNPHFIFNSLHSINKYVIENDKENASAYLSKFANLMRLILENSREQEVPLAQDLHALELYMQLEALRFKNRFIYSIETDSAIDKENTLIPPMLLQPFVENAIIHGLQNKENGLIKISVQKENDMICCIVEDNGTGRENTITFATDENKKHKSLGMQIISERLNIINQIKKVKTAINIFDLKDAENKPRGLRIELLLPFEPVF